MMMTRAEFTTPVAKENRKFRTKTMKLRVRGRFGDRFVAGAGEDGQARVFRVSGIDGGTLAEEE